MTQGAGNWLLIQLLMEVTGLNVIMPACDWFHENRHSLQHSSDGQLCACQPGQLNSSRPCAVLS